MKASDLSAGLNSAEPFAPQISIGGAAATGCVRALAPGLTAGQRLQFLAASLRVEVRVPAWKAVLWDPGMVTA